VETTEQDHEDLKVEVNTLIDNVASINKNLTGEISATVKKATSHLKSMIAEMSQNTNVDQLFAEAFVE